MYNQRQKDLMSWSTAGEMRNSVCRSMLAIKMENEDLKSTQRLYIKRTKDLIAEMDDDSEDAHEQRAQMEYERQREEGLV